MKYIEIIVYIILIILNMWCKNWSASLAWFCCFFLNLRNIKLRNLICKNVRYFQNELISVYAKFNKEIIESDLDLDEKYQVG
jgi:hypothetical protein